MKPLTPCIKPFTFICYIVHTMKSIRCIAQRILVNNHHPSQNIEHYQHTRIFPHAPSQLTIAKITTIFWLSLEINFNYFGSSYKWNVLWFWLLWLKLFLWDVSMWLHEAVFRYLYCCILFCFKKMLKQKHLWNGRVRISENILFYKSNEITDKNC